MLVTLRSFRSSCTKSNTIECHIRAKCRIFVNAGMHAYMQLLWNKKNEEELGEKLVWSNFFCAKQARLNVAVSIVLYCLFACALMCVYIYTYTHDIYMCMYISQGWWCGACASECVMALPWNKQAIYVAAGEQIVCIHHTSSKWKMKCKMHKFKNAHDQRVVVVVVLSFSVVWILGVCVWCMYVCTYFHIYLTKKTNKMKYTKSRCLVYTYTRRHKAGNRVEHNKRRKGKEKMPDICRITRGCIQGSETHFGVIKESCFSKTPDTD